MTITITRPTLEPLMVGDLKEEEYYLLTQGVPPEGTKFDIVDVTTPTPGYDVDMLQGRVRQLEWLLRAEIIVERIYEGGDRVRVRVTKVLSCGSKRLPKGVRSTDNMVGHWLAVTPSELSLLP